jgi:TetR/AcrR family transcriptional repressor of bet genes
MPDTDTKAPTPYKPPRKASRDARRQQLIEATIRVLARRGYAAATLTEVAVEAGVSHGMVNFHFQTKQNLLTETLDYLAEEYRANWTGALERSGPGPARQLAALVAADFEPQVCTPVRLSAWCSFWGEAQSKPIYQAKCGANDAAYNAKLEAICADLIAEGGYAWDAAAVARALRSLLEGLWLEMMTTDTISTAADGLRVAFTVVAALFPRHFNDNGLREP